MASAAPFTIRGSATQRIHAAANSAQMLLSEAERAGARRVFIVSGHTLAHKTPHVHALEQALGNRHVGTFTGVGPHTPADDVVAAIAAVRAADTDMLVTVGGGAQTDAGKIVILGLRAGVTDLESLRALSGRCGWHRIDVNDPALTPDIPLVCIPTTLSGGEFSAGGGAAEQDNGAKLPFMHRYCAPTAIILDPGITLDTPDDLWFSTGIRAVDHAVEALASLQSNIYCDVMAQSALRLLVPALRASKASRSDLNARVNCQIGVSIAMIPLLSGVPMGASHAIGHALATICHVGHGHTSCILMPAVQRWNAPMIPHRHALIGEALGTPADHVPAALAQLVRDLGLPGSLSDVGVAGDPGVLERIAALAAPAPWVAANPRPLGGKNDIRDLVSALVENQE